MAKGFEFRVSSNSNRQDARTARRIKSLLSLLGDLGVLAVGITRNSKLRIQISKQAIIGSPTKNDRRIKVQRFTALLLAAAFAMVILAPASGVAQTRKRTATKSTRTAAPPAGEVQRQGAGRVAEQIKILTKFIYLLGGVAKGLEGVDDAASRNEASAAIIDQAKQSKATVRASIQSVREGLDKLEIDFRATPGLQRYYIKLAGVASGAAKAEELAAANQFDKAGRTLLDVVNHLTDVLLEMR
jgi:hypothetical protein